MGGVSSTDMPISNVGYSSWSNGKDTRPCSWCRSWAQDAARIGAPTPAYAPGGLVEPCKSDEIVEVCLASLVKLFAVTLDSLRAQYVTQHAFAWSHDPYKGGAFALFGPGQFKDMYPTVQELFCGGKFTTSGEALSTYTRLDLGRARQRLHATLLLAVAAGALHGARVGAT